ncbi:putative ca2+-modulated nonselective cation channel polycystin [Diplodia seriata]|uniref:Putative ca2+-modulated nonselective cation channel polycystin n=1 Tax=Diplodia seriata TaxID=420778 RepID=A0A0G2EBY8_9PEZI|nr:putative ca2+-modulated nonselective cation channel polycystin [Diplodia seriata]
MLKLDTGVTWGYEIATTTFNLIESVQEGLVQYDMTSAWDPATNQTTYDFISFTLPMPAAATTSIMSRTEYSAVPTTPLTQQNIVDSLYIDLPPAEVAFTGPSSTIFVAPSGTPFVAYSSYEVEKAEPVIDAFGKVSCKTSVTTYDLAEPYAFEYDGDALGSAAEASGGIPADFLQSIPQSSCVAGTYQGPVTIIYVLHIIYGTPWTPFIGHVESSVEQLELPTITAAASSTYRPKSHVESSAEDLPPSPTQGTSKISTRKGFDDYIAHIESALSELGLPTVVVKWLRVKWFRVEWFRVEWLGIEQFRLRELGHWELRFKQFWIWKLGVWQLGIWELGIWKLRLWELRLWELRLWELGFQ